MSPLVGGIRPEFLEGYEAPKPVVPDFGFFERAGIGIANAPAQALENTAIGLSNIFGGEKADVIRKELPQMEYGPAPGTTGTQMLGDFVGHGLAPMALQLGMIGRLLGPTAGSISPLGSLMAKDALGFGLIGAQEDRLTAAEQAVEGAGYGYLASMPRMARLPYAALLAAGSKAFFDRNGGTEVAPDLLPGVTQGDASGALGFITSLFPGQIQRAARTARPGALPDHFATNANPDPVIPTTPLEGQIRPEGPMPEGPMPAFDPTSPAGVDTQNFYQQEILRNATAQEAANARTMRGIYEDMTNPRPTPPSVPEGVVPEAVSPAPVPEPLFTRPEHSQSYEQARSAYFHEAGSSYDQAAKEIKGQQPINPSPIATGYTPEWAREGISRAIVPHTNPIAPTIAADLMRSPVAGVKSMEVLAQQAEMLGITKDQLAEVDLALLAKGVQEQSQRVEMISQMIRDKVSGSFPVDPRKGKLSPLREWQRSAGGSAATDLLFPLARAGAGGTLGYAAGGEEGMAAGIALGLTPEAIRLFFKTAEGKFGKVSEQNNAGMIRDPFAEQPIGRERIISTALKLPDGRVVTGERWNTPHKTPAMLREAIEGGVDPNIEPMFESMGFLIEDAQGKIRWADRMESKEIVERTGQAEVPPNQKGGLISENLRKEIKHSTFESPSGDRITVGPSDFIPGQYQATRLAYDGTPLEHKLFGSREEAIQSAQGKGTNPLGDEYFSLSKAQQTGTTQIGGKTVHISEGGDRLALEIKNNSRIQARFDYVKDSDGVWRPTPGVGIEIYDAALRGQGLGQKVTEWVANNKGPVGSSGTTSEVTAPAALKMWKRLEAQGAKVEPRSNASRSVDLGEASAYVLRKKEGLRSLQNGGEGGFVFPELNAAMSRATLGFLGGGAIGGATNGPEGFLTGGVIGAAALAGGPTFGRRLLEGMSNMKTEGFKGVQSKAREWAHLAKNFGETFRDKSGNALSSSATASDRFVRWLDNNLGITVPLVVKEALLNAKGQASHLLDTLDTSLRKVGWFNPEQGLKELANQFLDGNMEMSKFLDEVKNRYPGTEGENYAKMITTSREVVNGLQKMVADGLGNSPMKKIIEDSIGKYLTRSYKMFTDANWSPSQDSINNLVKEMLDKKVWGEATPDDIHTMLAQYIREVKATKGIYKMGESPMGAQIAQQVMKQRKELSGAWKEFLGEITDPTERVYQTVFRLRPMAEASRYFSKLVKEVKEDGWLPHAFDNYNEMFAFEQNLKSQADHFATVAKDSPDHIQAQAKLDKFKEAWKGQQNVENHPKFGELKGKIVTRHVWDSLATFDNLSDNIKSPFLRSLVNAHTFIKLGRTAFNPITIVRNFITSPAFAAIGRATPRDITEAVNIIKDSNHPLRKEIMEQGIGNVDQVKTEFYKEFENLTGGKYKFGEVDLANLGMGKLDLDLAEKVARRGVRSLLDVYRYPDNLVRIGTYLSAKNRIAQQLGKALEDPEVITQATRFTNRYTMNYDAVSPIVKKMRQLPGFNLFITYTAEMTRILKNLAEDVVMGNTRDGVTDLSRHGRAYAVAPLAALATLPELIQSASEANLSPQDKAEWDKVKKAMPAYARGRYRFGIERDKKTGAFRYKDFTPLIASDSLNQMITSAIKGDTQAAMANNPVFNADNTPIINMVIDQFTGEDHRTGRAFRGQLGEMRNTADRLANLAKEALPPWFPPAGSEWQKLIQATSTNAEGTRGITNTRTGVRLTPQDFLRPYLTGIRAGEVNPDIQVKRAISETKREIANETAYLNDVLNSDLPDAKKNAAMETFRRIVLELQDNLRQRLGTDESPRP